MDRATSALALLLCIGWAFLAGAACAWGQSAETEPASATAPEGAGEEDEEDDDGSFASKLVVHGFLSQAYAFSDGNQIVGIPEEGTTDYRTAALQMRMSMTENDTFAVQLSHERLGRSPVQAVHEDVELDWIFYERRFGQSGVKVGRLPIPFGIYNEVRDVGTILPFYRPARPMYEETSFATETIDGVLLVHRFDLGGGWLLDGDVHYGTWETFDAALRRIKADNSVGIEIWLATPVEGLRLGLGGFRFDTETTIGPATIRAHRQLSHLSIDGRFGRVQAQIEIKRDTAQFVSGGSAADVWGGYGFVGVELTDRLTALAEYDFLDVKLPNTDKAPDRDRALGVSYRFRSDLVLKAEYHWVHGFRTDEGGLIPGRPVPDFETQFGIVSLATSF